MVKGTPDGAKSPVGVRAPRSVCLTASWLLLVACSAPTDETDTDTAGFVAPVSTTSAGLNFPTSIDDMRDAPELLSETGAFEDVESLSAAAGLLPYSVQNPLWSDGAQKQRWLALPAGGHVGFSESDAWSFPEGTVLVKHFGVALDEAKPEQVLRLETRFLIAAEGGDYYGLVYKWDKDQADARLLLEGGEEKLDIVGADGVVRQQTYTYPSQSSCGSCHSGAAGFVMGVRTSQLNGAESGASEGDTARNQLVAWSELGVFEPAPDVDAVDRYPRLAPLSDETRSVEDRVRSYWDSNCSMCHNPDAPLQSWDARYGTPLAEQGVLLAEPSVRRYEDDVRLIVPGDPLSSLMYMRAASVEPGMRMPPLLRNRADADYLALLEGWISGLTP